MIRFCSSIFEDAESLLEHLAAQGFRPYVDFEILAATISDGVVEVDPHGELEKLRPHLETFARAQGFWMLPFDPESGTISLQREDATSLLEERPPWGGAS